MSEVVQLYKDKEKQIKAYPKTLASEVYMSDGVTSVESSLDSIARIVYVDGTDNTVKIQQALDLKGKILLYSSVPVTTVISNTLYIGSNTTLEMFNVTVKLKDNTHKIMLRNKNAMDENIKLINCSFDGNRQANYGQNDNQYGMLLVNITNMTFENLLVKNTLIYAILIANINNFICNNLKFENCERDGIHFQPPCNDIFIKNISGGTNDDLISFTIGDYSQYEVTNVGDITNVSIERVVAKGCATVLKLTGSGLNNNNIFKNISIKDIKGVARDTIISIIDDTNGNNTHLTNTVVQDFICKDVNVTGFSNFGFNLSGTYLDFVLENIYPQGNASYISISAGTIRNAKIDGLVIGDYSTKQGAIIESLKGNIESLTCSNFSINRSVNNLWTRLFDFGAGNTIKTLNISNIMYKGLAGSGTFLRVSNNTVLEQCNINNFYIADCGEFINVNTNVVLNANLSNGTTKGISTFLNSSSATNTVRLTGNANLPNVALVGTKSNYSVNSPSFTMLKNTTNLVPLKYDEVVTFINGYPEETGLWRYNGTSWVKQM